MDWFNPGSLTVASFAEFNIQLVILLYTCSLRNKTKNTYLILIENILFSLYSLAFFLYNPAINNYSVALYQDWFTQLAQSWFVYSMLFIAYLFHKDLFPRQAKIVLSLFAILTVFSHYFWFKTFKVAAQQTSFNILLFIIRYLSIIIFAIVVLTTKILKTKVAHATEQDVKAIKAYKGFLLVDIMMLAALLVYLFSLAGIISNSIHIYIEHILTFCGIIIFVFSYLNYSEERTSFQFKLVCIVLCTVHLILGLLPFALYGNANPNLPGYPKTLIYGFLILIPVVTLAITFLLPLFLRNNILKPLDNVMQKIKEVNAGNLSGEIKIEVNDEIGLLTENFNRMNASLQRYANKMNDLVDERTNELNKSLQELKSTQAQLIQSEKMASLGELTAGIAHEIQNPLNFVNNFSEVNTELIEELEGERSKVNGERDEELEEEILNDIKKNEQKISFHGKRADAIVKGMLQHSRASTGKKEPTDINALADEYLRLSYHGLRAKDKSFNADFTTDFDESIGKVNVVPQDIGRVLLNLYNNAFYAVSERQKVEGERYKPEVTVATKKENDKVSIVVSDNGTGIPQKVIDKIFQPFFTTKPTGQGTGLGLSLAYDIITKEHNGTIKAQSKEGEGSVFIIQLPVV